jgi:ribonuclease T2
MGCRLIRAGLLAFALCGAALSARADQAGVLDLYVLALSWNSTWCAIEGDERGAAQCETGARHGFTLHGLWPQYEGVAQLLLNTRARPK